MGLTTDEKVALLRRVELFAGLAPVALASVADKAVEVEFAAGRSIVRQGEIGTGFFLIVDGSARVVRDDDVLATLGPGEFLGELSLLDHEPRTAHVIADRPTACLAIASWDFDALVRSTPDLAIGLLKGLARRLRIADERARA